VGTEVGLNSKIQTPNTNNLITTIQVSITTWFLEFGF